MRSGKPHFGSDRILLDQDDNIIADTSWNDAGFTVAPFLPPDTTAQLRCGIQKLVVAALERLRIPVPDHFSLEHYHRLVNNKPAIHEHLTAKLNKLPMRALPIPQQLITQRISDICGLPLTSRNPHFGPLAPLVNLFGMRIVRPQSSDHNPLHRDVWLNRLRNAVNIYIPIAGSDARSSLTLVPGSHTWPESTIERTSQGAILNGRRYTVPAVTGASRPMNITRPNPGLDEVLVFSPYLIHGGASNLNEDASRFSLEIRFWRD